MEPDLSPNATLCAIVDVSCEHYEGSVANDRQFNKSVECIERGISKGVSDTGFRLSDPLERSVQM